MQLLVIQFAINMSDIGFTQVLIILCSNQQIHNYFTNYHTPTYFDTIVSFSGSL